MGQFTAILPGQPVMQPNTAVALLMVGIAGALRLREDSNPTQRALSLLAAAAVLAIGIGSLFSQPFTGRPSPSTALALALLSTAILILDCRPRARARPSEWLAIGAFLVAFIALVGLAYGAGPLYRLARAPVNGMALSTSLALLFISAGLLLERPTAGVMRLVTSPAPGGIMLRWLALPVVLAALLMGPAIMRTLIAFRAHDSPVLAAVLTFSMAIVSLVLLAMTARPLNRAHKALESSRARVRELFEFAPEGIFIADLDGRIVDVNGAGCRMLARSREEIVGRTVFEFIPAPERDRLSRERDEMLQGRAVVSEWDLRRPDGSHLPTEVSASILADGRWQGFARDISERKRAEEQLRQSRERLDLVLRGADLATWDWNVKTGELIVNSRWAGMRGFRPEEIEAHVGFWIADVHPEDWPRVERTLQDHLNGKSPEYEAEYRVRTQSGEWLWVLDRGKVFARDEHGEPLRMAGTELDITNQKRLEERLRLSLAQASGILAISADAIISVDENQRVTMFNDGAEKILGCSKAEAIGGPLERWIPERFRTAHRRHVDAFGRDSQPARRMGERGMTVIGRRHDGSEFPADAAISKLDVEGRKVLTVALRDITEQKRIEREERLLSDFASVLASTIDYDETLKNIAEAAVADLAEICIVESVEEHGRIPRIYVAHRDPGKAHAVAALRRHPLDMRQTRLCASVIHAREPLVIRQLEPQHLESFAVDPKHLHALQDLDLSSLIAVPLSGHLRILGTLVLLGTRTSRPIDSSDVHLAEKVARLAAGALENALLYRTALQATQVRDEVLGIVAHDLRNPLSVVALESAVLRRIAAKLDPRTLDIAANIGRATERMSHLIDDLLDLTLIETGHLSLESTPTSVGKLIDDFIARQRTLAAAASIELVMEVEAGLPEVRADRHRIQQALENLVSNAIKFAGAGGRITVGARRHDDEVRLWVTNSGAAIPAEHLPLLFDRFWQARQKRRGGAGLGLAIVKGIIEAHGGHVWAQSAPDRGTTFTFTIPTAAAESVAEESSTN